MGVKITLYRNEIRKLNQAAIRALERTTDALCTEIVQAQVIPFKTGHLQEDATFFDVSEAAAGHTEIVSSTPYARRLYYHPEFNFNREDNPNAKAHWFEDWADGGKKADFTKKKFEEFYKQEAGL